MLDDMYMVVFEIKEWSHYYLSSSYSHVDIDALLYVHSDFRDSRMALLDSQWFV
jgi:hypothetical protein